MLIQRAADVALVSRKNLYIPKRPRNAGLCMLRSDRVQGLGIGRLRLLGARV
jgi:hypothetical protein